LPNRYWISPGGRALELFRPTAQRIDIQTLIDTAQKCDELGNTSHFHLDLFGNYIPGLCAGLSICRDDLGTPLSAGDYPIICRLYSGGIGSLFRYAREHERFQPGQTDYWSKCELCYEIRHFLVADRGFRTKELQPAGHYFY
jgi:hypothetical protein